MKDLNTFDSKGATGIDRSKGIMVVKKKKKQRRPKAAAKDKAKATAIPEVIVIDDD